ncbi:MAG: lytic transglycosylase domain-containing protein, partial [Thermodesulfobacteriota bacterium]
PKFLLLKKRYSDRFDEEIIRACTKFDVDPQLVKAIIKAESNFDEFAISPKSAEGLMQLMPETAKEYGVSNSFDPKDNIEGGVKFFRHLLDHFENDLSLSIAAYNAGKQAVINYGYTIPPFKETEQFVKRVLNYYDELSIN